MAKTVTCFGELLIRLTPPGAQLMVQAQSLDLILGGAEANVASGLASLGHDVRFAGLVTDNALGDRAVSALRGVGVDTRFLARAPGRMGLYFLSVGAGLRASEIVYDRAGSSFAATGPEDYDFDRLLAGAGLLHLSGITPALGPRSAEAALADAMGYDFHRGVVALVERPLGTAADLGGWMDQATAPWTLVLCPCLADAANAGAIVRNAAALGADGVVFGQRGASPLARKAIRASSGALFRLPLWCCDPFEAAGLARQHSARIIGTALEERAVPLECYPAPAGSWLLIVGAEAGGLNADWCAYCDDLVSIPMTAGVDSLNAGASTAIFLWDLLHRSRATLS